MKRIYLLYTILLCTGMFAGCNDFLEESSQSEVRPTTVDELYQVMLGEAYPRAVTLGGDLIMPYLEFFTDNMQHNPAISTSESPLRDVEKYQALFTWKREMYEESATLKGMGTWDLFYRRINGCNVVLDYLDRVTGDQTRKMDMKGQVLVLRAWWYFQLVNLYGLPYNVGDPSKNLGVPLKLDMDVTDKLYARSTVAEVYAQVELDLLEGVSLLDLHGAETSKWKMNSLVGRALLSRVYLYMENWDKAISYADTVLESSYRLCDFSRFNDVDEMIEGQATGKGTDNGVYNANVSDEIIWMYGTNDENSTHYTGFYVSSDPAVYAVSDDLINCFERVNNPGNDPSRDAGDLRRVFQIHNDSYYGPSGKVYFPYWVSKQGTYSFYTFDRSAKGIRNAELYLNRAEAYVQKYRATGNADFRSRALADLNTLRASRFDTRHVAYVPVEQRPDINLDTPDALYNFCLQERRRELMFEDHRWFDLRRTGMPRLVHVIQPRQTDAPRTYVLEAGSTHYVLPIPESVMRDNAKLEQNKYND